MSPRVLYRTVAVAEAVTWTLLIVGMLLKYVAQLGSLPVLIGGSVHGLVFITYAMTAVLVGVNQRWPAGRTVLVAATAVVPYATIPLELWLDRSRMLDGPWRTAATGHPADHTWVSRLLRWFLARPRTLVAVFVLGVAVVMATLLVIGPPGGRSG